MVEMGVEMIEKIGALKLFEIFFFFCFFKKIFLFKIKHVSSLCLCNNFHFILLSKVQMK